LLLDWHDVRAFQRSSTATRFDDADVLRSALSGVSRTSSTDAFDCAGVIE